MNKLRQFWDNLRSSFWFLPSLMVTVSIVFADMLIETHSASFNQWLNQWPRLFGVGAEGARLMLSTLAGSMITVMGITFSMTLLALVLASGQYTSRILRNFMRNQTNQDIAASIIGHIRRAALGEPLVPFEQRVDQATQRIYQSHQWLPAQRKWLERLAKQLVHEVIIDREFVNNRFCEQGGAKQLDKVPNNQLDSVLEAINDELWDQASS